MQEVVYTDLLALVEQDGFQAVRTSTSRGGQYNGPCPWCGGEDRFRVQPHQGSYGWYACSQCGRKGNAVDYLVDKRGCSKYEALMAVGWQPKDESGPRPILPASALDERPQWDEPPEIWQQAASDFYRVCQDTLWSETGRAALDYLRGRGLTDEIIAFAKLGYHAREEFGPAHVWGRPKAVALGQGIVIPWLYEGKVWRLTIRNERAAQGQGRYRQVSGGSNGLYLADSLKHKRPAVVVTEGEFDALSIAQTCGKRVAVVATGTTQGGHTPRWIALLARQERALIAFDSEEKGDVAAHWWLTRLSDKAVRLRPLWKDANQMLQDGADLAAWVAEGLAMVTEAPEVPEIASEPACAPPCAESLPTNTPLVPGGRRVTQVGTFLATVAELVEAYGQAPGNIALDLETTGLDAFTHKVVSIALGVPGSVAILDMRPYYSLAEEERQRWQTTLCALLTMRGITWVGQNLKFDWQFLKVHFGASLETIHDTMLVEQVLHGMKQSQGRAGFNLRDMALRYGLQVSKEERKWFQGLDARPTEWAAPFPTEQLDYMVQDIEVPYRIAQLQQPLLEQHSLQDIADLENFCVPALASLEYHGMLVDQERWRQILRTKEARRAELERTLITTLGQALTTARELQEAACQHHSEARRVEEKRLMQEYISNERARSAQTWEAFRTQGLYRWTKEHREPKKPIAQGQTLNLSSTTHVMAALAQLGIVVFSTQEEALEEYASHPIVTQFLAWRKLDHFCKAFGEGLLGHIGADGRIHAHFAQVGAVSGRIICSKPNLQQIPKKREQEAEEEDIRRCFIAPPGCVLVKTDLSNIELRILAEVSRDETMLRFFAEGRDLHVETARLMFRLPEGTNTKEYLYQGVAVREIAKTINYGLSYGMGAQSLALRVNVSVEEARKLMKTYIQTYPGVDRWLRQAAQRAQQQGYTASLLGRKRFLSFAQASPVVRASMERMARNHPIQATNADILKRAMAILYDVLPAEVHMVLVVHDEIVLECPEPLVEEAVELLKMALVGACRMELKLVHIPEPEVSVAPFWKK